MRSSSTLSLVRRMTTALLVPLVWGCADATPDSESWPLSEIESPDSAQSLSEAVGEGRAPGSEDLYSVEPAETETEDGGLDGDGGVDPEPEATPAAPIPAAARPYRPPAGLSSEGPFMPPSAPVRADFEAARFPRPEHVRGLYVNAWAAGSTRRMAELLEIAATTEVNALVIDIKDATGFISHETDLELAREIGADGEIRIRDLPGLLDRLDEAGIYPIARIVVVKDPLLAAARPETAVQDTAGGVWIDSKEIIWQNLFNEELWAYNVALAREVAEMGFPEIQWDYIRFPDAPASDMARAVFTGGEDRLRVDAVRGFLSYAREELADLPVRSTADVFGVTTTFRRDIGIGQLWESFIDVVDVALPMVYPSHYWEGSFGYSVPNAYPYEVVFAALRDALRRSESVDRAGLTRPWLQDFSLGRPAYGPAEVRAQIQATYDVGVYEWILWNPSTRYSTGALEPVGGFENDPLVRVAGVLSPTSRRFEVMDSVSAFEVAWFEAQEVAPETGAEEPSSTQSEPARAEVPSRIGEISPDWTLPVPNPSPATDTVPPIDTLRFTAFRESG
ncbi:MAG: putative glycoside hydrolase [Longimicrobiales bacterium]